MASMAAYIRLHHFYALLEAKHNPSLRHQPFIVTQAAGSSMFPRKLPSCGLPPPWVYGRHALPVQLCR